MEKTQLISDNINNKDGTVDKKRTGNFKNGKKISD
jgi:hypothetical protein